MDEKSVTLHNIEVFEEQVRQSLAVLKIYKENLEKALDDEEHKYYYLTVIFGIDTYEGYLKWCKKAKKILAE